MLRDRGTFALRITLKLKVLKVTAVFLKALLGPLPDVRHRSSDDVFTEISTFFFHHLPEFFNAVRSPSFFHAPVLDLLLNVAPKPVVQWIEVRAARRPISSASVPLVGQSRNHSCWLVGHSSSKSVRPPQPVEDILGRVRSCAVL